MASTENSRPPYKLQMMIAELNEFLSQIFPQINFDDVYEIIELRRGEVVLRLKANEEHLRPGGTMSGPAMMSLVDLSAYALILAHAGKVALAVTTNLNINFLNKPVFGDLVCTSTFLKNGKRLVVTEHQIKSVVDDEIVAHATATYSMPPA